MPLGKLSKRQIEDAYKVLTELQQVYRTKASKYTAIQGLFHCTSIYTVIQGLFHCTSIYILQYRACSTVHPSTYCNTGLVPLYIYLYCNTGLVPLYIHLYCNTGLVSLYIHLHTVIQGLFHCTSIYIL